MSHTPTETIICPNCGSVAEKNYCSECGQETHLHNDSFWGLVMHFIGHYFHYDSKFWKTLRALWFSPGKLTTAYWKKQRMRYIPPVSLYIFISAVFFIAMSLINITGAEKRTYQTQRERIEDSLHEAKIDSFAKGFAKSLPLSKVRTSKSFALKLRSTGNKLQDIEHNEKMAEEFGEKFSHQFPKVFFFLIPLMAVMLKLFFIRKKQLLFVHHAIFSLHVHSFSFSILLFTFLPFYSNWISLVAFSCIYVYIVAALKNVYNIGWVKSILYSSMLSLVYGLFALIATVIVLLSTALI
ncbi:MAG: DUF3667 domain-containing protein [Bacteroidetes bacterium]|nr:DUF3667 domain-containing protein [Bacteroidota bacterium]